MMPIFSSKAIKIIIEDSIRPICSVSLGNPVRKLVNLREILNCNIYKLFTKVKQLDNIDNDKY